MAAPPLKMSVSPVAPRSASPPLGRDSQQVLAEAGFADQEIANLLESGVIR